MAISTNQEKSQKVHYAIDEVHWRGDGCSPSFWGCFRQSDHR